MKNILNLYESFFDDLDKLNQDKVNDEFGDVNRGIYDEHDIILSPDKNPEFFYGLCDMCEYYQIPYNKNGFLQEDLNQIENIYCYDSGDTYFKDVTSLDELQYFNNLENIFSFSFYHCTKLKSVIFPKNLEKLYDNCFSDCFSLKKLKFPNSIKEIYKYSFNYCTSLKEILFPKNIEIIENLTFKNCTSLEKIVIPERFKDNMKNIFYNVDLSKVDITYI